MLRTRRGGLTLTEVLVTLLILSIGLLSVLTLFPLGAVNMGRAVRDDRSYQCARSLEGTFRAYWKPEIVEKAGNGDIPLFSALETPGGGLPRANPNEWSYPVVVDPWGYIARQPPPSNNPGTLPDWIGDTRTNVPRRTMMALFGLNQAHILSGVSLKDTVGYDENLRLTADREYRYNAMVIIQRPLNRDRYAAYLTVVAFDNRPFLFAPAGSEIVYNSATFFPGTTTITVDLPSANVDVKPGKWVMDVSVNPPGNTPARPLIRHANLYQVVSVTPQGPSQTILEVQPPVQTPTDNNRAQYNGTLVALDGVSGVYRRSPLAAGE